MARHNHCCSESCRANEHHLSVVFYTPVSLSVPPFTVSHSWILFKSASKSCMMDSFVPNTTGKTAWLSLWHSFRLTVWYSTPNQPQWWFHSEIQFIKSKVNIRFCVNDTCHIMLETSSENLKLNELGRRKLERQNSWRETGKQVKLYSDLLRVLKDKTFDSSGLSAEVILLSAFAGGW